MKKTYLIFFLLIEALSFRSQTTLQWAKKMGGTSFDISTSIAVDASGNVYTIGSFSGTADFDPGAATSNLTSAGEKDIFISKLSSSGNFVWCKRIGNTMNDEGNAITVDALGNVYTTGFFIGSCDFDPGPAVSTLTAVANENAFILKLTSAGNFVFAKKLGATNGTSANWGNSIKIDASGNIFTTGAFKETIDFDPGPLTYTLTSVGYNDAFISKLDNMGNFIWAKVLKGAYSSANSSGDSMELDALGNVYTTGYFQNIVDFDPGVGTYTLYANSSPDEYIAKLDANGDLVWARRMGGSGTEWTHSIAIDGSGNVYTTGMYLSYDADFDPGPGTFTLSIPTYYNAFISKLNAAGDFVWAKSFNGYQARGNDITTDAAGNVYTTGAFVSTCDFDPSAATYTLTGGNNASTFISKLDPSGNFLWAESIAGNSYVEGQSLFIDAANDIHLAGVFQDTMSFSPIAPTASLASSGSYDVFVCKLSQVPASVKENSVLNTFSISPNPNNGSFHLKLDAELKNAQLIIINSVGQKVHEQKITKGTNQITTHFLSGGLYSYIVVEDEHLIGKGKIIIE